MDLFKEYKEAEKGSAPRKSLALHKFLRQILCEMLSHKCNKGILTDSYTYIFLEIDLKRCIPYMQKCSEEKANIEVVREMPINYTVKSCHSANVTLRQTLLDFFNISILDGNKLEELQGQMTNLTEFYRLSDKDFEKRMRAKRKTTPKSKFSESHEPYAEGAIEHRNMDDSSIESSLIFAHLPYSKSSDNFNDLFDNSKLEKRIRTKDIIVPKNKFDILKHGHDRFSQVYSIESSYLSEFLKDEIETSDRVVIKIHDPWYYPSDGIVSNDAVIKKEPGYDFQKRKNIACEENYKFERICYKILDKDLKFNPIAYDHDHLKLSFCCQRGFFRKGMTNIFKYIETQELPKNPATYQKAVEQFEIIHKYGVIHNDISERNILYSKDEKVYIIDYSLSLFSTYNNRVMKDINDLKSIFF